MNTSVRKWEVLGFIGESSDPETIKRLKDGEIFTIGDYVANGVKMKGYIQKFDYSFRNDEVFVYTTWSGVGMNLDSIQHATKLPSGHQIDDHVWLSFGDEGVLRNCTVSKVHFSNSKVMYDIDISGELDIAYAMKKGKDGERKRWHTRIHNVDSAFVSRPIEKENESIGYAVCAILRHLDADQSLKFLDLLAEAKINQIINKGK